jgi:hypothetical protein
LFFGDRVPVRAKGLGLPAQKKLFAAPFSMSFFNFLLIFGDFADCLFIRQTGQRRPSR